MWCSTCEIRKITVRKSRLCLRCDCKAKSTTRYARKTSDARTARDKLRGMLAGEYDVRWKCQNGRCALCHQLGRPLHVDHDHETGVVRGLICCGCNTALGRHGDSAEGIAKRLAASYPPMSNVQAFGVGGAAGLRRALKYLNTVTDRDIEWDTV